MKKIWLFLFALVVPIVIGGCDLQPKIMSLPDSVGEFIADRYPALLADPDVQPEIYNSAASDYGVYASPELYGSVSSDDYILYADINDYMFPAQAETASPVAVVDTAEDTDVPAPDIATDEGVITVVADVPTDDYIVIPMYGGVRDTHTVTVAQGETLYAIARRYGATVDEVAKLNNINPPYSIKSGQKLIVPGNGDIVIAPTPTVVATSVPATKPAQSAPVSQPTVAATNRSATPARVQLQTVTVQPGDTLYSLSRKFSVPVNDLAVMNNLVAPFNLTVGQKIKVPNLAAAADAAQPKAVGTPTVVGTPTAGGASTAVVVSQKSSATTVPSKLSTATSKNTKTATSAKETQKPKAEEKSAAPVKKTTQKISSDPNKKLPKIAARSSSKFSWPVRGKILSDFGSKPNGLVNDGINISAARGTPVGAAENGVVAYAGNEVKGMGNLVILQHADGWMTVYAHLDSMAVRRGAKVSVGQKIGAVGSTGKVDRPQLHFEIRKGTKAYNPAKQLKK